MAYVSLVIFSCVCGGYSLRISSIEEHPQTENQREIITADGNVVDLMEFPTDFDSAESKVNQHSLLMLYTTSGSKVHMDSFCLNMQILARPSTPLALKSASILISDNGGIASKDEGLQLHQIDPQERIRKHRSCLEFATGAKKKLYMSARNVGYRMGGVQAIDILFQAQLLEGYDWVIHQHPDVYLIYPNMAMDALQTKNAAIGDHGRWGECWKFDWFAFRPNMIHHEAFHNYKFYEGIPECYLKDHVFKGQEVQVLFRNCSSVGHSGIDSAGIWHSHDPKGVREALGLM